VFAGRLVAQTTSEAHIPIKKETAKVESAAAAAQPPIVIHDTVIVYKTDSLGVFQSAVSSAVPDVAAPGVCHNLFVPIPIPIPFSHHSGASAATAGTTTTAIGTTTTPEPASVVLVGTGLLGLTVMARKKVKSS
jgi:hypothetical protein